MSEAGGEGLKGGEVGVLPFLIRLCILCCMHIKSIEHSLKYWVPRTHDMI